MRSAVLDGLGGVKEGGYVKKASEVLRLEWDIVLLANLRFAGGGRGS